MQYLSEIVGQPLIIPEYARISGAIGCALLARQQTDRVESDTSYNVDTLIKEQHRSKSYFFPPLTSEQSVFPDISGDTHYESRGVEVDVYDLPKDMAEVMVYLGIDIGSTSTKAVITHADDPNRVLLGLYTRTKGQPIKATQSLLHVLEDIEQEHRLHFQFRAVGTTGSGRKFIQKVIGADMAVDEITAHARAAYALNPKVDTIIEIGGQDAKFTILKDGQVTFSVMNYVCAAGTGSFIEEQAKRLDVPLSDYAQLAVGARSPLSSDRCTVFMERDLNHFMSQGYSKSELLAAVLHSVRDNYLSKVAHLNKIGNVLCFQGATAKNRALVMAFEQKLQKPIFVSRYCHLTGALGVCIMLHEEGRQLKKRRPSGFRGIAFHRETPEVYDEICIDCKNHCKLKRVRIGNESFVWGFLCGRDENGTRPEKRVTFDLLKTRRRVFGDVPVVEYTAEKKAERSLLDDLRNMELDWSIDKIKENVGLNLLQLRHLMFQFNQEQIEFRENKHNINIGIPSALYMQEYVPFWKMFFTRLGYNVVVSHSKKGILEKGKEIAGAEFCAPISNWHGHVQSLSDKADYLFLPQMFVDESSAKLKYYCYYSNYAVSLVKNIDTIQVRDRAISPIINFARPALHNIQQIYESLPESLKLLQTPHDLKEAYLESWRWFRMQNHHLVDMFEDHIHRLDDIAVVLVGRPYLVLDSEMNKSIPQKFAEFGIYTFYQDMLPPIRFDGDTPTGELLSWNHWKFGDVILNAAEYIGGKPKLYPVLLTAFKCSPDSFVLSYFKEVMDAHDKPYLVLQIDEHGSAVGYETRIEAAIRSFRNHYRGHGMIKPKSRSESVALSLNREDTILIPNFDNLSCSLICAALEHAGYKTQLIEETPTTVISSLRMNDGQCLPISAITQGAVETIQKYGLPPERTAIFLNTITKLACNFPQYPLMAKKFLQQYGGGFEQVKIYATEFEMRSMPLEVIYDVYCSYLLGGLLRRMACKIRPYEVIPGQTEKLVEKAQSALYYCIAAGESKETIFRQIVADFADIPVTDQYGKRPKVSIIGDLYVRDNDVFNQQLVRELEMHGAEVVTTPYTYILRMLAQKHTYHLREDGRYLSLVRDKLLLEILEKFERRFFNIANEILDEDFPEFDESFYERLTDFNLSLQHGGETAQNLIKIYSLMQHYPDIRMFIHVNPIFCCPALVSESIFKKVEQDIGVPIVSITYDGTSTRHNDILSPYLHYVTAAGLDEKDV